MAALTRDQKRRLYEDGYVQIPGAIPEAFVQRALHAINHDLSLGIDPAKLPIFNAQSFCPAICGTPPILDLFERSGARAVVESATGPLLPADVGQCALRWPESPDSAPLLRILWPHIDGTYTPTNGVPAGSIHNFTALACMLLSDLPTTAAGNFTVWPGSHRLLERYYRERGEAGLLDNSGWPNLGTPRSLTGRAGDLIIAQYLLGHDFDFNRSPHIRYAVFFRLVSTAVTPENRVGAVTLMWRDWQGMREMGADSG